MVHTVTLQSLTVYFTRAIAVCCLTEGIISGTVILALIIAGNQTPGNSVLAEKKSFLSSSSTLFPFAHLQVWIWAFAENSEIQILTLCLHILYVDVIML